MFAVRFHGRGGQGAVTAADLLSTAAFLDGRHAVAFPSFGAERTGAPVTAYCRIDDEAIRSHEPIAVPDAVVVLDPTLLFHDDALDGLPSEGYLLVGTSGHGRLYLPEVAHLHPDRVGFVPAAALGTEHVGRPLPNAALLGAFAALTGHVTLEAVEAALRKRFEGATAEGNVAAARAGHDLVRAARVEVGSADA
jgi:pyruvate ferredoxin oxidoreductase gamma subunit